VGQGIGSALALLLDTVLREVLAVEGGGQGLRLFAWIEVAMASHPIGLCHDHESLELPLLFVVTQKHLHLVVPLYLSL